MKKYLLGICFISLLLTAGCSNTPTVTGKIDAEVCSHYSEASGKIIETPVSLGQEVKAGDILVVLDDTAAQYQLKQAQQTLLKAQYALAQASETIEPENIQQSRNQITIAEQNYNNAQAAYALISDEYQQQQQLYEAGAVSQSALNQIAYQYTTAKAAMTSAAAQLDNARQQLALLQKKQTVSNQIRMAETDVQQAKNQVEQITDQLADYVIRAACDGTVLSFSFHSGSLINAGALVADISVNGENYWIGYVPEQYVEQLHYGQQVTLQTKELSEQAEICYMDVKQQYAPEEFQRSSTRNEKTVKVKCRLSADSAFVPGQEVQLNLDTL